MNGKHERMKLVARQSQLLSSITELAVSLRRPPQDVVPALFLRLDVSDMAWHGIALSCPVSLKRKISKSKVEPLLSSTSIVVETGLTSLRGIVFCGIPLHTMILLFFSCRLGGRKQPSRFV